jgi:hypothetical protein
MKTRRDWIRDEAAVRGEVISDDDLHRFVDRHSHRKMVVLVEPRAATVRLAHDITRITGRTPHYLRSAGAFVVEASGGQLAELATLPSVARIGPSRHVHAAHDSAGAEDGR